MSEATSNWIVVQQKAVEVSGRHAERLVLLGPDDKPWAQWPMSEKKLGDAVEQTMIQLQESLANGKHRGQLVVYDNKGDQWAAYPVVLAGRNTNAATAGAEARTLQQATAVAISNMETVLVAQRNVIESLLAQNELLREDNATLVETINEFRTNNIEVDLKVREHEERKERLDKLAETLAPVLAVAAQHFGDKVIARAVKAQKKKEALGEQPQKDGGNGGAGGVDGKPGDGSTVDAGGIEQGATAEAGERGGEGSPRHDDAGDSGRVQPPAATPLKVPQARKRSKVTRSRVIRTKPLTRKGKKR